MTLEVIIDTREKTPWMFHGEMEVYDPIHAKLDTGDYSLKGYEDRFCIERKSAVSEIGNNVLEKRFQREIQRMSKFSHAFLLFEFSYADILGFPENSNLHPKVKDKIKVRGPFIVSCLSAIQINYGIHIIPAGDPYTAEKIAVSLMKRFMKHVDKNN